MKTNSSIQYTIRQVPRRLDRMLRQKSRSAHQSLNQAAIDALTRGLGLADQTVRYHELDALAGTWIEDPAFDAALEAQHQIDPNLWK